MEYNKVKAFLGLIGVIITSLLLISCAEEDPRFSILSESNTFYSASTVNNKLDIIYVIDNSGSMRENQANLAANFDSFINGFIAKGYDFQIAVTTTDAWEANYGANAQSDFRGCGSNGCSGVTIITPSTPDITGTFNLNIVQGSSGDGDERGLESLEAALEDSDNAGFLRSDAYLAVIFVTDEEDFSNTTSNNLQNYSQNYSNSNIIPVSHYVDYLDNKTGSSVSRSYNAFAITINPGDSSCLNANSWGKYGNRYQQLIQDVNRDSNGNLLPGFNLSDYMGSICDSSFASILDKFSTVIGENSSEFVLNRIPIVASIEVIVNGAVVPNNASNGWTYNAVNNSVKFHGSAVPSQGDQVIVNFDPEGIIE